MVYNTDKFVEMTNSDLEETNAGAWYYIVAGVVVVCVGIYNGYKDTKDQKK